MYFILSRQILVENFGPLEKKKNNQPVRRCSILGFIALIFFVSVLVTGWW